MRHIRGSLRHASGNAYRSQEHWFYHPREVELLIVVDAAKLVRFRGERDLGAEKCGLGTARTGAGDVAKGLGLGE